MGGPRDMEACDIKVRLYCFESDMFVHPFVVIDVVSTWKERSHRLRSRHCEQEETTIKGRT